MGDGAAICVIEALTKLGGRERLIPGARLSIEVAKSFDLKAHLKATGQTFLRFLESIQEEAKIKIVAVKGTDIRVGFSEATYPTPPMVAGRTGLRQDVFDAFTRFGIRYYYDPANDEFTKTGHPGRIPSNPITLEDALRYRREFAENLEGEAHTAVLATLDKGMVALREFSTTIRDHGLISRWRAYYTDELSKWIGDWASANNVKVNPEWFQPSVNRPQKSVGRRGVLLAMEEMAEEDWGRILIPLAIVEKMLARAPK